MKKRAGKALRRASFLQRRLLKRNNELPEIRGPGRNVEAITGVNRAKQMTELSSCVDLRLGSEVLS